MEVGDNYGSYLAVVYPDSRENNGTNSTNGVRPVIKLKYTTKIEKTTDSLGNILWHILEE